MRLSYVLAFSSLIAVTAAAPSGEPSSSGTQSDSKVKVYRLEDYHDLNDPLLETHECQVAFAALNNDPHLSQCEYRKQLDKQMELSPDVIFGPNVDKILEVLCPSIRCDQKVINRVYENIADSCISNPVQRTNFLETGIFYTPFVGAGCFKDYDGQWIVSKVAAAWNSVSFLPEDFCPRGPRHFLGTILDYATKNGVTRDSHLGGLLHTMEMYYREKCPKESVEKLTKAIGPPVFSKMEILIRQAVDYMRYLRALTQMSRKD